MLKCPVEDRILTIIGINSVAMSWYKKGFVVKTLSRLAFVNVLLLALTSVGWAGPGFPSVRAAASANGKFVVTVEVEYLNPDEEVRTITRISYRVLRREEFMNDKFLTTASFWSDEWGVSMAPPRAEGIPLPFISDDGKYLVLVSVDPPFSDDVALRIYREKHRFGGEDLLGTYKLKDIWTADELKAHADLASTGRPLWFAGSTLGVSADSSEFIVLTPWGREVRLDLNGTASHSNSTGGE